MRESAAKWLELERQDPHERKLVARCGNLAFGTEADIAALLATHSSNGHDCVNVMNAESIQTRWPDEHIQTSVEHKNAVFDSAGHGIDVTHALQILAEEAVSHGATIHRAQQVTAIDRAAKTVYTRAGHKINYSQLASAHAINSQV